MMRYWWAIALVTAGNISEKLRELTGRVDTR